ncbi:MAG TPA: hypothetical protein ENH91_04575 [Leeuwenhoekiella sp.]|nr:hypothetical protein [Leeuwenhoekiella sp.]
MIENFTFLNQNWLWPVLIAGFAIWLIFVILAWFSGKKRHFLLKAVAAFFAVAALVLIALKPALRQEQDTVKGVLLTSGYAKTTLDSLEDTKQKLVMVNYKPGADLSTALDSLSDIFIIGNGIKTYDFWQLKSVATHYLDGKLPHGIIKRQYDNQSVVGKDLIVDGLYSSPKPGTRVVLQDPGGAGLDSVALAENESDFRISAPLKATGKLVYKLVAKDSLGKVLTTDPLPVEVQARQVFNVLILNDFPAFETKYLKDYLAEMGHKVLIRSKLTKGRFKFEYFNRVKVPLSGLSQAALDSFDLLIIDSQSLKNLPNSVINGLKMAIIDDGLGVFVQADVSFFQGSENLASLKFNTDRNTSIRLNPFPRVALPKSPFVFEKSVGLETVHETDSQIISAYKRMGKGRVGSTVLEKTYELLLNGKKAVYNQLWSELLEPLGKRKATGTSWETQNGMPYLNEPFRFSLSTSDVSPVVTTANGNNVSLKQYVDLPEKWEGRTYPRKKGWNQLRLTQDTTKVFNYFVTDATHWKAVSAYGTIQENKRFFNSEEASTSRKISLEPVSFWWFFAVFVLCMGYLWLEPKLDGD